MIFVTVGTTLPFDELIAEIDRLVRDGDVKESVICQIGTGVYEPTDCQWFRFRSSVGDLITEADIVIGHGGTGTTLELLNSGKHFVLFANPRAADSHQAEFLAAMQRETGILWSEDVSDLGRLLSEVRNAVLRPVDSSSLGDDLLSYVRSQEDVKKRRGVIGTIGAMLFALLDLFNWPPRLE